MNKIYSGKRGPRQLAMVYVDSVALDPTQSLLIHHHSSDFEWSYGGSGPHQLALAILWDMYPSKDLVLDHYRAFCQDWLVPAPYEGFVILESQIREWLEQRLKKSTEE